jgi:DNA-binding XRE family transcriptional regulator
MYVAGKFLNQKDELRYIMSAHMKARHIKAKDDVIRVRHAGIIYIFPKKVAEKYRITNLSIPVSTDDVFSRVNKNYTKPGALLRGIRARENLTQNEMAKIIKVTQSDISQMETGTRNIGRTVAKRIEKIFGVSYRSFLE